MTGTNTVETITNIDLWSVAEELTLTTKHRDNGSRQALRRARRARRWHWTALISGSAVFLGAFWAVVGIDLAPWAAPVAGVGAGAALIVATYGATNLLSAQAYRAITALGKAAGPWFWWLFTLLAYASAGLALLAAVSAVTIDLTSTEGSATEKTIAIAAAAMGVMLAIVGSSACSPLVSTAPRPRLYQAHGSQFCWTGVLLALIAGIVPTALWLTEPAGDETRWVILSILIPVGAGVVASVFAWHRRTVGRLEEARIRLADRLADAIGALADPNSSSSARALALHRLENVANPTPFRSQSPAAPPTAVAWEIGEILRFLIFACGGDGEVPVSIRMRARDLDLFARLQRMTAPEAARTGAVFLRSAHRRLFPAGT